MAQTHTRTEMDSNGLRRRAPCVWWVGAWRQSVGACLPGSRRILLVGTMIGLGACAMPGAAAETEVAAPRAAAVEASTGPATGEQGQTRASHNEESDGDRQLPASAGGHQTVGGHRVQTTDRAAKVMPGSETGVAGGYCNEHPH